MIDQAPSRVESAAGNRCATLSTLLSLVCFIVALRHIGAARTGAYFATALFIGALVSPRSFSMNSSLRRLEWQAR